MLRAVIVDDEPPARAKIRRMLAEREGIAVIGESGGGTEAIALIEKERPDLLFLDIQMPELDGFALLGELHLPRLPAVIFTTAYDSYALRAFEVHALDYLLKPFDAERFARALERAEATLGGSRDREDAVRALLAELAPRHYRQRFLIREGSRIVSLRVGEIIAITSEEKYVRIRTEKRHYLHRESLQTIATTLDPSRFPRIHRSTIINLDRFGHLEPAHGGDYLVVLEDGTQYRLGRNYRGPFLELLEGNAQ